MKRFSLILLAALLAALALAPAASAVIKINKCMAGIQLRMTQQQVRDALGDPRKINRGRNDFSRYTEFVYKPRLRVFFQGNTRVSSISTTSPDERTRKDVGVGSTEAEVKAGVNRVICETIVGHRSCHRGRFLAGKRVTDFQLNRKGKVKRVVVAIVID